MLLMHPEMQFGRMMFSAFCQRTTFHTAWTHSGSWMFGRIFGLDGRESYRKLRLFRYVALTVKAEVLRAGS